MNIPTLNKLAKELDKVNPTIDHALILRTHRWKLDKGKYSKVVKEHKLADWNQPVWYEIRSDQHGSYYQLFTVPVNNFTMELYKNHATLRREILKKEAREAYDFRGHKKADWENQDYHTAILECPVCGKYVQVNSKPMPNQINIGGDAVALDCND